MCLFVGELFIWKSDDGQWRVGTVTATEGDAAVGQVNGVRGLVTLHPKEERRRWYPPSINHDPGGFFLSPAGEGAPSDVWDAATHYHFRWWWIPWESPSFGACMVEAQSAEAALWKARRRHLRPEGVICQCYEIDEHFDLMEHMYKRLSAADAARLYHLVEPLEG